jgi:hypothetical protein
VIADTKVALLTALRSGANPAAPQLGLLMERAAGKTAFETDKSILGRPDVASEVTKLQLLDHLTGQGDRHRSNYFVAIDANKRAKVTGIDNDQCFGEKATDSEDIRFARSSQEQGFRVTLMPPFLWTTT